MKQTTMANEVAREVSQRVIEESSASGTPVRLAAPTSAPVPVTMTHSTPGTTRCWLDNRTGTARRLTA